jgi:hypothetical protein
MIIPFLNQEGDFGLRNIGMEGESAMRNRAKAGATLTDIQFNNLASVPDAGGTFQPNTGDPLSFTVFENPASWASW